MIVTLPLLKAGLTGVVAWPDNDEQVCDLINEAHGLLTAALGWEIVATHTVEALSGSGTASLFLRRYPVCTVNSIALMIPGVSSTPDAYNVYNPAYSITRWDTGQVDNYSAFAIQLAGQYAWFPKNTPVSVDYVYGFPMANIAGDVAASATTLTVDNPLGFRPGEDYRIEDGLRTETFTLLSVAGDVLTTTAPLRNAHGQDTTRAVTNMPREVVRVVRRVVERRLLGKDSPALRGTKSRITKGGDLTESFAEVAELTPAELALLTPNLSRIGGGLV